MTDIQTSLAGVTLHVADVEKSLEFYQRIPGVAVRVHRPGEFAMLQIGAMRLSLLRLSGQGQFHVELDSGGDVDAMYAALENAGIQAESPPTQKPWGQRDFYVRDPDGNILEFD